MIFHLGYVPPSNVEFASVGNSLILVFIQIQAGFTDSCIFFKFLYLQECQEHNFCIYRIIYEKMLLENVSFDPVNTYNKEKYIS